MRVTVVETPEFSRKAKALLTEVERMRIVDTLSVQPEAGVSLGGGLRKVRFAREGGGKSGGFRTIHFYAPGQGLPVFLMDVFAKNERENVTAGEQAAMNDAAARIAGSYGGKK
ncbi:type II toxin-antitoxin system RelE/ParE family toxin [Tabrizicola sp.]|uniref:type II toxin-antitoxin system RelE/ParE family toxin n=1 Tax=Tabrizicola sp. TaxID=2005166 RepID=UPI002735F25F|nr:type II toxin-antitoxin system RelE/ParE family toxin [Tabrizicola sp.]MDP3194801.1 type II toxin-antitoxin system RelE/ParE family toxin [Tabrizicola sp.]